MKPRSITRISSQGVRTVPIESQRRAKHIRGNITLNADELALALDMARTERIEQAIRDYAYRKQES